MVLLLMLLREIDELRYWIRILETERILWHWATRSEYAGYVEEAEKRSREAARREETIRNHIGVVAIGSDYYYQLGPGIRVELPRVNERDLANVPSSTAAGQVLKLVLPVRDVAAYGTPSLLESLREFLRFIREKS